VNFKINSNIFVLFQFILKEVELSPHIFTCWSDCRSLSKLFGEFVWSII